ncbi:putative bifunctional diguanylate cyclase/phosphodiesterase [Acetobacter sp.]|jgi:diguanylate cyclase (GGDEF)-like protein/PAS domain S-box-containing protein|uniref:putative bifunctional diguanylate cyclase/phosphodiesterase n=1 Tax=Acetobacter sp. TaxID=440 RepID=UPI0025BDB46B|nr:EAL domain-containing protein [Acetobacter sp.]MCH4091604.1 EAL domain-containing protein [Acetobacter sp.]MCI1301168.1 EAL domain-containing protein [Acetobacter sp.]MCI1317428.1 EAL domain-containing protein [Acetobacter sp.]
MERLFTFLLSEQHVRSHMTVILQAFLFAALAIFFLSRKTWSLTGRALLFSLFVSVADLTIFFDTFWSTYPNLSGTIPQPTTEITGFLIFGFAVIAAYLYLDVRRSIKTVIMSGALLAFGLAFSAFDILVATVSPATLAYDLSVVLGVLVAGATLCAFAFWELGNPLASRPRLTASILLAFTLALVPLGSMGSILPFDQWLTVIQTPDSALFSPLSVLCLSGGLAMVFLLCIASLLDIRVATSQQREGARMRHLADGTFEGILISRDNVVMDANQSILDMTGLDLNDIKLLKVPDLFAGGFGEKKDTASALAERVGAPEQLELLGPAGRRIPVEVLSREVPYVDGQATVVAIRDVTERKAAEDYIRYLAMHDTLTSLPNRRGLENVLGQVIEHALKNGLESAVLGLDLDGFKAVNDSLGHHAGDMLLKEVAVRFQAQLRDTDYLARLGGDEFVIVLRSVANVEDAIHLAKRLIGCLWQPFTLAGHDVYVGVSIGVALCPRDGDTAQMVLKNADIAMYQAKIKGKGQVYEFQTGMETAVRERHDLELDLRAALGRNELQIYYQPLFNVAGVITGFEALARWPHPERGMISPDRFIPLAEETGLIVPLGEWVLKTACMVAAGWQSDVSIAVNLSPTQFQRVDLVNVVMKTLEETGLEPARLELEVTETLLMEDVPKALALVRDLRALGVRVALDDFGTGYSSLAYLHNFPFDKVKVDRSFINKITNDPNAWTIVESIIVMSHKLKLRVTAEGIETGAQLSLLTEHGCDEMQGFLLGRPMPEPQASRLIASLENLSPAI